MKKKLLSLLLTLLCLIFFLGAGCPLVGTRQQSPPGPTPAGLRTPTAPTKKIPGVRAVGAAELKSGCKRVIDALTRNDWATATKETNTLGLLWTRFKPTRPKTMSVTEMKDFDLRYAELQREVRRRNKDRALDAAKACRDIVTRMER